MTHHFFLRYVTIVGHYYYLKRAENGENFIKFDHMRSIFTKMADTQVTQ